MRICCWNVRGASEESAVWPFLEDLSLDLALLQEVIAVPKGIRDKYETATHRAAWKKWGTLQRFSTALLVRGTIGPALPLTSAWEWVNRELEHFKGNLLAHQVKIRDREFRVLSAYCPAWPVEPERLREVDVESVKLKLNPDVWVTELLWAALRDCCGATEPSWIVGGDLNASETFDQRPSGPRGNREILDRMEALDLQECLRLAQGRLVPTFRNPSNGQVIHLMDHLFVSKPLAARLISCEAGDQAKVFDSLSDHLPIIAEFRDDHHAV